MATLPVQLHPDARTLRHLTWGQRVWVAPNEVHCDLSGRLHLDASAGFVTRRPRGGVPMVQVTRRLNGYHVYVRPSSGLTWYPRPFIPRELQVNLVEATQVHTSANVIDALRQPAWWKVALAVGVAASPWLLGLGGIGATLPHWIAAIPFASQAAGVVQRAIGEYGPQWIAKYDVGQLFGVDKVDNSIQDGSPSADWVPIPDVSPSAPQVVVVPVPYPWPWPLKAGEKWPVPADWPAPWLPAPLAGATDGGTMPTISWPTPASVAPHGLGAASRRVAPSPVGATRSARGPGAEPGLGL